MCGRSDGDCGNELRWLDSDGKTRELGIRTRTFRECLRTECSTVKGEILSHAYSLLGSATSFLSPLLLPFLKFVLDSRTFLNVLPFTSIT
jgi:hypothetical protein